MKKLIWQLILVLVATPALSQNNIAGVATDGSIYLIDPKTAVTTKVAESALTTFEAGAIRQNNTFYYVGAPSGTTENALFKADLKTGTISFVDLDRSDHVAVLFHRGKQFFAIFYDGTLGTRGLYQINKLTGATTLVQDLTSVFPGDPVLGAFARQRDKFLVLARDNSNSATRHLATIRLTRSGKRATIQTVRIQSNSSGTTADVSCDKIKSFALAAPKVGKTKLMCIAALDTTSVAPCLLNLNGTAKCAAAVSGIERTASGHTLVTDGKAFYFFGYAHGESVQRLVQIDRKLGVVGIPLLSSQALIVNARMGKTDEPE